MAKLTLNSKVRLNSGYEIPVLGFGVYLTPVETCEGVVKYALEKGYRHVDSAVVYGNEAPSGAAIRNSGLPREEIFFTTKIPGRNLSYDFAKGQVNKSLKDTGLEYIDLILLHAPFGGPDARKGAWKALVEAQEEGKIRSLGVSNYGVHHLEELEAYIKELEEERGGKGKGGALSVNQLELHPWLGREDIVQWSKKRGILLQAYSPLVQAQRLNEPILKPIIEKYGKSAAQVLLRWSLQKGFVPLPKSVTPTRIEENAAIFDFELTEEEVKSLETEEYAPVGWDPTVATLEQ